MSTKAISKKIDGKMCMSTAFLAESMGVTSKTIAQWEKKGCPKAAYGWWYLPQVMAWRDGRINDNPDGKDVSELPLFQQKVYWETRYKEAQAENQRHKNALLRGDYLEREQVARDLAAFFPQLQRAALSLPEQIAAIAGRYLNADQAAKVAGEAKDIITDALDQWNGNAYTKDKNT